MQDVYAGEINKAYITVMQLEFACHTNCWAVIKHWQHCCSFSTSASNQRHFSRILLCPLISIDFNRSTRLWIIWTRLVTKTWNHLWLLLTYCSTAIESVWYGMSSFSSISFLRISPKWTETEAAVNFRRGLSLLVHCERHSSHQERAVYTMVLFAKM